MKKTLFAVLAVIAFCFSTFAMAEIGDCAKWDNTMDRYNCRFKASVYIGGRMTEIAGRLYQDSDNLGLTDAERVGVKKYHDQVNQEIIADCGYQGYECQVQHYTIAINQLEAYEAKKKSEKKARSPKTKADLGSFINTAPAAQRPTQVSPEERALMERVNKAQKKLDAIPTYNADNEVGS